MGLVSLMLALALFLIVAAFVLQPILQPTPPENDADTEANFLQARRATVLTALADLDFEHATGKIDRADFEAERSQLVADGVAVLRQIDKAGLTATATVDDVNTRTEETDSRTRKPESDPGTSRHSCPQCNATTAPNDRFCDKCDCMLDHWSEVP